MAAVGRFGMAGPLDGGPAAVGLRLEEVSAAGRGLPQRGVERLREGWALASGRAADAEVGDGMEMGWGEGEKMVGLMGFESFECNFIVIYRDFKAIHRVFTV